MACLQADLGWLADSVDELKKVLSAYMRVLCKEFCHLPSKHYPSNEITLTNARVLKEASNNVINYCKNQLITFSFKLW